MARRPKAVVDAESQVEMFVGNRRPRKERKKASNASASSPRAIERHVAEQRRMRESGDWTGCGARHLVALYIDLHEWCYGVRPVELRGKEFQKAVIHASRMLEAEFGGRVDGMLDYLRWSWRREKKTEKWRRENKHEGGVLTWHELFMRRRQLTRYRIQLARKMDA